MALALKKSARSGGGNKNGRYVSYNAPLRMTADRNDERAICELVVDAYGLSAGTMVALTLLPAKPLAPGRKARPELKNFRAGGKIGSSPKFGDEVLIIAERSYKDDRETIEGYPVVKANWIKAAIHDMAANGPSSLFPGFVSVGKIRERTNSDGETYPHQTRSVYINEGEHGPEAFGFNSMDEFKANATEALKFVGSDGEIIVRVTSNDAVLDGDLPEGEVDVITRSLRLFWNRDEGRQMTIEESIDFFLDGPAKLNNGSDNPNFGMMRGYINVAGTADGEGLSFDAVVNRTAPTGTTTLENLLEKRVRQSEDEIDLFNMKNGEFTDRVFIKGSLILRTAPRQDNPEELFTIATDTFALDRFGPTYLAGELPGARPEEVQAVFDQRAKERGEKRYFEMQAARTAKKEEAESLEMDGNDPAPAGLTPVG